MQMSNVLRLVVLALTAMVSVHAHEDHHVLAVQNETQHKMQNVVQGAEVSRNLKGGGGFGKSIKLASKLTKSHSHGGHHGEEHENENGEHGESADSSDQPPPANPAQPPPANPAQPPPAQPFAANPPQPGIAPGAAPGAPPGAATGGQPNPGTVAVPIPGMNSATVNMPLPASIAAAQPFLPGVNQPAILGNFVRVGA